MLIEILLGITSVLMLVGLGASFYFLRSKDQSSSTQINQMSQQLMENQMELSVRLKQLSEQSITTQEKFHNKMQEQERQITDLLTKQIKEVRNQLSENLEKTHEKTQNVLTNVQTRLAVIDDAQKNLTNLSGNIVELQNILNNKQARGAFGELQLEKLVEDTLPPNSYEFQAMLDSKTSTARVDCLIKLPYPPGPIPIDSKFPLEAFYNFRDAKTDAEKTNALKVLAINVEKHLKDISEKYIIPGKTADNALMFLPSEAVYAEIHASLPKVIDKSYQLRVFIVSPTTLWATLNTVRAVLKDVKMREQAHIIQDQVRFLSKDVERLDQRVEKLQRHFSQAQQDVDQIRVSTDKIHRKAEKIDAIEWSEENSAKVTQEKELQKIA